MSVLLGADDGVVTDSISSTWSTNKIGGKSDWMWPGCRNPICSVCGWTMSMVIQSYCPLEASPYHRTLYVFACVNKPCWGRSESWQVLRSQIISKESRKTVPKSLVSISDDWGTQADDWGTQADDWGTQADDWGTLEDNCRTMGDNWGGAQGDNWGDEIPADKSYSLSGDDNSTNQIKDSQPKRGDNPVSFVNVLSESSTNTCQAEHIDGTTGSSVVNDIPEVEMKQMNLEDGDNDTENNSNVVQTEDFLLEKTTVDSVWNLLSHPNPPTSVMDKEPPTPVMDKEPPCHVLESYYISVVEEPGECSEDSRHVQRLLQTYQQADGCDLDLLTETSKRGDKKGGNEVYERGSVHHGDKTFYKFSKRLGRYPKQCIRYEWNGMPLFISMPSPALKERVKATCPHCGSDKVFELQLMPALIHQLHYPGLEGPAIEFGTVHVFTCGNSCWKDGDCVRTETVIVQADPDAHLFRS